MKKKSDQRVSSVHGLGPEAPTVTNERGGKQSHSPYRCDLLPAAAVLDVSEVLAKGAAKYGANNWRNLSIDENLNHLLGHVLAWLAGDRSDDHLSHAACRALFALDLHMNGEHPRDDA
jgi:hypothetical protein